MPNVYIVDHQPSVKKRLTKIIHELGYESQEIPGGKEVIGTAWQESMDLLLLDAELPGMDGYQVLTKLKEARKTVAIPVIMLTARGYALDNEDLAIGNIRDVLSKPFSPRAIVQQVQDILSASGGDGGADEQSEAA